MTGTLPFVYLSTCGCVFSASGLRALAAPATDVTTSTTNGEESKHTLTLCPQCLKPYEKRTDVLTINPSDEEETIMRVAMEATRGAAKAQGGKSKKRKAVEMEKMNGEPAVDGQDLKRQRTGMAPTAPKTNAAVAAMARKVTESLAEEELKRKTVMSDAVASLYGPRGKVTEKETFMTMGTFTRVSWTQFMRTCLADVFLSMHNSYLTPDQPPIRTSL
jgi:Rtf2 RING-finger